jgi:cytoskeletal protein CcmA (bactofilin family)
LIEGQITGREDVHIDGEVRGQVRLQQARILVGERGRIHADVEAREVEIHGEVDGQVRGHERVRIGARGVVQGDVLTQRIAIDEGGILQGSVDIVPAGSLQRPEAAKARAATAAAGAQGHAHPGSEAGSGAATLSAVETG